MPISEPLARRSLSELKNILQWLEERGEDPDDPTTVLIGGWAVYAYNPYFGSIDIDLITNNKTRKSLMYYLRKEHGYSPETFQGRRTVTKMTEYGKVIIDFGSRETKDRFEGRAEVLDFGLVDGNTVLKELSGLRVPVPSRALMVLFKLKAAHDREYRIQSETSHDLEWEKGKLVKDYADVLALVDPERGGAEIDIGFLGENLVKFPFLEQYLQKAMENLDGIKKYGTTGKKAEEAIGRLLKLL